MADATVVEAGPVDPPVPLSPNDDEYDDCSWSCAVRCSCVLLAFLVLLVGAIVLGYYMWVIVPSQDGCCITEDDRLEFLESGYDAMLLFVVIVAPFLLCAMAAALCSRVTARVRYMLLRFRPQEAVVTEVLPPSEEQPQPPPDNTTVPGAQVIEMQVIDPQV